MGRPERQLPADGSPLTGFARALRATRLAAGNPSYRELSAITHYSVTTLARAADGRALPSLPVTLAYARACGEDTAEWRRRWAAVAAALRSPDGASGPVNGPAEMTSLPPCVPDFTGRARALRRVKTLLRTRGTIGRPVVAVIGPAGVGKTTLAVRAAHDLAAEFPGGRIYVQARDTAGDPVATDLLAYRVLVALGAHPKDIPADAEARRMLYHRLLRGRPFLLVVDDVVDASRIRPLLPSDPHCAALLTSRLPLDSLDAVRPVQLGNFTPAEARRLLEQIVGRNRVVAEPAAAQEILQACGMLPLAVRIAGTRLGCRPSWTLREMAGRLADERRRLDELTAADIGVRTSLALGVRQLDQRAWRAFRLLGSLDVIELTPWIAAAALRTGMRDAASVLDALAAAGLVEPAAGPDRFRFHDLVRLYARESSDGQDTDADRAGALESTLDACTSLAHTASCLLPGGVRGFPGPDAAGRPGDGSRELPAGLRDKPESWLAAEEANLLAIFRQACRSGLTGRAMHLGLALLAFLELGSRYDSWRALATTMRDTAEPGSLAHAYGLYLDGVLASELGRPREAVGLIGAAAVQFDRCGERRARAYADVYLANNHHGLAELGRAIAEARRALQAFQALHDRQGLGYAHLVHGSALAACRLSGQAAGELGKASEYFQAIGHAQGEAHAIRALAHVQAQRGQYGAAAASYRRALQAFGARGGLADVGIVKLGLASALHGQGEHGQALSAAREAADTFRRLGNCFLLTRADHMIARVELALGQTGSAVSRLELAIRAYGDLQARLWQARALRDLGRAWASSGHPAKARTAYARAQKILTDETMPDAAELRTLRAELDADQHLAAGQMSRPLPVSAGSGFVPAGRVPAGCGHKPRS